MVTCRNVREAAQGCSMRRQDSHGQNEMAKVVLKDLKKVYPNTEKKKKPKKGEEPEKKSANRYEKQVTKLMRLNLDVSVRCGR